MKIQYASDLHLEFDKNANYLLKTPIIPQGEILILAGDITYLNFYKREVEQEIFNYFSDNFEATYLILGNHEFYGGADAKIMDKSIYDKIKSNVFLVNNKAIRHGNALILFTTLWSEISKKYREFIVHGVNDFRLIKYKNKILTDEIFNLFHKQALAFLKTELLAAKENEKIIIATHHVPSEKCSSKDFEGSSLNEAFVANLTNFIEQQKIDYWIYGHSHRNMPETIIGQTKLVTNQLGYISYNENVGYRSDALIEI